MTRNTWRRTAFTSINGNVEIAPDDWTLLDPSGKPLARLYNNVPAARRTADGIGAFYSCETAAWETAGTDLQRRAVRRGKPARRAYWKQRAIEVPHWRALRRDLDRYAAIQARADAWLKSRFVAGAATSRFRGATLPASCSSGSISASQVGHRSLQRQSHSSHQSVPQGQVWCFRNHGISVVLIQKRARGHGGFRDRLLAGQRAVRAARPRTVRIGTVVATRAAGEACAPLRHSAA